MKKFITFLMLLLCSVQSANAMNFDAFMDKHIAPVSNAVANIIFYPIKICGAEIPIIIFWILVAGLFFTIYLKGIPVWGFMHSIHSIVKPSKEQGANDDGSGVLQLLFLWVALGQHFGLLLVQF